VVQPNEKIKLRVLNGHTDPMALHIHGHKATETHYDGVEHPPASRVTRDVYSLAPAQRLDLELNTTDDGLHSFGSGLWMFHDHTERAFTTDGVGEGGSISLVAYKDYLDDKGTPKTHGMDLSHYFSKKFWQRKIPIWQNWADDWGSLGAPAGSGSAAPASATASAVSAATPSSGGAAASGSFGNLLIGLFLGILAYIGFVNRAFLQTQAGRLINRQQGN
jgi:hypothetical protein